MCAMHFFLICKHSQYCLCWSVLTEVTANFFSDRDVSCVLRFVLVRHSGRVHESISGKRNWNADGFRFPGNKRVSARPTYMFSRSRHCCWWSTSSSSGGKSRLRRRLWTSTRWQSRPATAQSRRRWRTCRPGALVARRRPARTASSFACPTSLPFFLRFRLSTRHHPERDI